MRLTFETPSKRCPARHYNGQAVRIVKPLGRTWVRRMRKRSYEYVIQFVSDGMFTTAYEDELFIERSE